MKIRRRISLILLFSAFFMMFGHDLLPHHHHSDFWEIETEDRHQSDENNHEHHNSNHHHHFQSVDDVTLRRILSISVVPFKIVSIHSTIESILDFGISLNTSKVNYHFLPDFFISKQFPDCNSLRAPPACN